MMWVYKLFVSHIRAATKSRQAGFMEIREIDNGPGIPEHILPRIFGPFFRTKVSEKGTVLGLSVSQGIVRRLGRDISVEGRTGRGSTFMVLLPTAEVPSMVSSAPKLEEYPNLVQFQPGA